MARISTLMYAESTAIDPSNQKLVITGPMHLFQPLFVPSQFSFSVALGILEVDTKSQNTLRFTFCSPKKEVLVDTNDITIPPAPEEPNVLPAHLRGIMFNLDFRNVILREEGEYFSEVFVNQQSLGKFPVHVIGQESKHG